jgi:hypothetical protein
MFTIQTRVLGLMIILLVLVGCRADMAVLPTFSLTRTLIATERGTAVAEILVTAVPAFSPMPAPAETQTPIKTPRPTNTRYPTFTPTFTPTPEYYFLPEWVTDPTINVLLTGIDEGSHLRISLYNAESGERFDLPIALSAYGLSPEWKITEDGFFIQLHHPILSGSQTGLVEEINLQTGEMQQNEIPHEFIQGEQRIISPDGRYTLQILRSENSPPQVTIIDEANSTEFELSDPFNNYYKDSITARWSPDSTMVAIVGAHWYEDFAQPPEHALLVHSTSGELLQKHENYFSHLNWSPTSPHQLLISRLDGDFQFQTPCILNFSENAPICLEKIADWRDQHEVKMHQFRWSPDGGVVSFIYWNNATMNNGLCYFKLENDEIFCPITSERLRNKEFVILHTWSPDGRYLIVDINPWGPESHDGTFTSLAIVSSDGHAFQPLGYSAHAWAWRPPIPSAPEE